MPASTLLYPCSREKILDTAKKSKILLVKLLCDYLKITIKEALAAIEAAFISGDQTTGYVYDEEKLLHLFYPSCPISFIRDVESRHFRTCHDTGADHGALFIWTLVRASAGLPPLTMKDLPSWNGSEYAMPESSNLLANPHRK